MNAALHATIWVSLCLFVAGEAGKRELERGEPRTGKAWVAWTAGAVLCTLHMLIAFGVRHGWSHAAAAADIARRTADVFGVSWGGGIYVNYLFGAVWLAEAWWWRADPRAYARRPRWITWLLRSFDFVVLANAAIVFATPAGRAAGAPLVAILAWIWRPARLSRTRITRADPRAPVR